MPSGAWVTVLFSISRCNAVASPYNSHHNSQHTQNQSTQPLPHASYAKHRWRIQTLELNCRPSGVVSSSQTLMSSCKNRWQQHNNSWLVWLTEESNWHTCNSIMKQIKLEINCFDSQAGNSVWQQLLLSSPTERTAPRDFCWRNLRVSHIASPIMSCANTDLALIFFECTMLSGVAIAIGDEVAVFQLR